MFFGLSKTIKQVLPKSLFYRSLLIVALPIIILQVIISVVFFDSIWIKANVGLTRSLVSELTTLVDVYNSKNEQQKIFFTDLYKKNYDIVINVKEKEVLKNTSERKYSPLDRSLRRELKSRFGNGNFSFNTTNYIDIVEINISAENNNLQFFLPRDRVAPSSVRLFLLWITMPTILLVLIAIMFLKNQTKPIVNLAKAAERFGKGDYINEIRPAGASEIRKAAVEFDKMVKRINRHLSQRSIMLSGISHDLRTPLTRIKLHLAMIKDKEVVNKLNKEIEEMQFMLNNYLEFAKDQSSEVATKIQLFKLIYSVLHDHQNAQNIELECPQNHQSINISGRINGIKRCFNNLINNAFDHGTKLKIILSQTSSRAVVTFHDNGPGVDPIEYKNILKPFYRLDKSRNLSSKSVGLGLSIVEDIVKSHGGDIQLSKSDMGGLCVKLFFPL